MPPRPRSVLAHFGVELRIHRSQRKLTQQQVADNVGYTASLIGAIERGERIPSAALAKALDILFETEGYDPDDEESVGLFGRLEPLVREHTSLDTGFREYLEREVEAVGLQTYEAHMIPGLLQTEEYARAVIQSGRPAVSPAEQDTRLAIRMTRQDVFNRDDPPRVWAIIDESALYRVIGSKAVLARQLDHLVDLAETNPNVTVQVFPFSAGISPAMGQSFVLAEFADGSHALLLESAHPAPEQTSPDTLNRYRLVFDYLRAGASDEQASAALLKRRADELRGT